MKKTILHLLAFVLVTSCNHLRSKDLPTPDSDVQLPAETNVAMDKKEYVISKQNEDNGFVRTKNRVIEWTPGEKTIFMTACVDGTTENMGESKANNYCACLLDKLEKLYPIADEVINLPDSKQTELSRECQQ